MARRGFTVVEILVSLAILAILSAVIVPQLLGKIKDSRTSALSQTFLGLNQGIGEYKKAMTKYPLQLNLLTTQPTTTNTDACGNALTPANGANVNLWRGPYVSRQILVDSGIRIGDARIRDVLTRVAGSSTYLLIDASPVEASVAVDLEAQLDGNGDPAGGTIRYTLPVVADTVKLSYAIPIRGC